MHDNISLLGVGKGRDGNHKPQAGVCSVSGINIDVNGAKAERAVIARGFNKGQNFALAVLADKSAVVFRKSFGFHKSPFGKFLKILIRLA